MRESPKAATTEGTINCYMEADACVELQIIPIPFARRPLILWSLLSIIAKCMKREDKAIE